MPKNLHISPAELKKSGKISFKDIPVNAYKKTGAQAMKDFKDSELTRMYRDITILREFEHMLNQIKTQGVYNGIETQYPGPAHLSLGQESAAVGQAYLLGKDDFIFGSHRSHSEILAKSLSCIEKLKDKELMEIMENFLEGRILKTLEKVYKHSSVKELAIHFIIYGTLAEIFARESGFHMGLGGSMHAFFLPFGVYPNNAIVGGSGPVSIGGALYKKCNEKKGVVICNIGDGSLGCGPVMEAMNFAAMGQFDTLWGDKKGGLPIIFNVFNNGYGMGGQTSGETMAYDKLARIGAGINADQMHAERVWGYNPLAVIDAYQRKLEILKKNGGPVLLDVVTYRHSGHSTSDQNAYRSKEEMEEWFALDPCVTFRKELVDAGVAKDSAFDKIWEETRHRMTEICKWASDEKISPYMNLRQDPAGVERIMFSNMKKPVLGDGKPVVLIPKEECSRVKQIAGKERFAYKNGKPVSKMKQYNYRDAIFEPILDKCYEDSSLILYGEDVRDWGGAFAVYRGLAEVLPHSRLFNAPISEAAIVGSAVGYGLCEGRVIVELMYCDFIGRAGDEIFNQLSKWQSMSAGILKMPVVLRVSVGSKYGAQHSQDWTALCAHIPGLKVCFPATPYEAKGLMQTALNGTDPVVFFESQRLYDMGEMFHESGVPAEAYELEIGGVNQVRTGKDVTLITVGATLYKAVEAAEILKEKYGMEADVINVYSLVPLDYTRIVESVKKTGRVVLASDACARGSFLNDIARNITELCFDDLDAPPVVVGAKNWITPPFEFDEFFFPQASWILDAIHESIVPLNGHVPTESFTFVEQMRKAKAGV
ncbi:MAG: thiamine pyrophosphate-dependent enzyme [Defluviitaleaceae bacterium]|nr:thiamine pyrophosphate-dependent enzyme [Defluviitaleaceae bacterium]MCL2275600.1 thiamine pyrophosphate-dependent enzyme [Defluviitaleaceae bacterium]